ncbi:helix-turn-helix transcriptional regulator [Citricoccus sp. K5]|uniref:helix-turn-helix transcriptional regulator n=1 Tax=Citricoccus sp. K5 TaxID=2653135 RepID=UPI0012F44EC0|nr:helix-turn-helix transcriptional regulator [Citricoccus sp. K5]VXA92960.1 hypothetical protein CITRIK5_100042 [Citricoccus sp. K5]VXA95586.1 hypothetical protein CITRIK5_100108 [Citricoccus sp. K5]
MSKHFDDRVRERREELGMTLTELAERAGYGGHQAIIRIENEGSVGIEKAVKIADILGSPLDELTGRYPVAQVLMEKKGQREMARDLIEHLEGYLA